MAQFKWFKNQNIPIPHLLHRTQKHIVMNLLQGIEVTETDSFFFHEIFLYFQNYLFENMKNVR